MQVVIKRIKKRTHFIWSVYFLSLSCDLVFKSQSQSERHLDVYFFATHLQSLPLRLDLMPILSAKVFLVDLVLAVAVVLAVLLVAAVWWRNIRLFPNLPDLLF